MENFNIFFFTEILEPYLTSLPYFLTLPPIYSVMDLIFTFIIQKYKKTTVMCLWPHVTLLLHEKIVLTWHCGHEVSNTYLAFVCIWKCMRIDHITIQPCFLEIHKRSLFLYVYLYHILFNDRGNSRQFEAIRANPSQWWQPNDDTQSMKKFCRFFLIMSII